MPITNKNIRTFVKYYLVKLYDKLPEELRGIPIGDWDVSKVTKMNKLFEYTLVYSVEFNESLDNWNVEKVTDMSDMFNGCRSFNQSLNNWNVKKVKNMSGMFTGCSLFNQSLNNWNVSKVTNMSRMFTGCTSFNQPLNNWNVGLVTNMSGMFSSCTSFNQPLNDWNVSLVTNMSSMFTRCIAFNQPLNNWNVSLVTNMSYMFSACTSFNQPLNNWNVSQVTNMNGMFSACTSFNQPLNNWNVGLVTNMSYMFLASTSFNQPLDTWNVSQVTDMNAMFASCTSFNQPLNTWNVARVTIFETAFRDTNMTEENKPIFGIVPVRVRVRAPARVPVVRVDAQQSHREAAKMNYAKLNSFLKEKSGSPDVPVDLNFPEFINESLSKIIKNSDETKEKKKKETSDLKRIMTQRLNGVNYSELSSNVRASIYYSLEYLKKQPNDFKKIYVHAFIHDCVHAYNGAAGMTCAGGALERIIFSFTPPCQSSASEGKENKEYETLVAIISANPEKLIEEYIIDWYKLHKTGTTFEFPAGTDRDVKRADLKRYLMGKIPGQEALVDAKITEIADNIGYDDDDFLYGGRRKTKKNRKTNRKTNRNKK